MRIIVLFWLTLDVLAALLLLYDYRRWYGRARTVPVARRRTRSKQRIVIQTPTTTTSPEVGVSGKDEPIEQLAVNG